MPLVVAANANDLELGVVLIHRFPDGSERPIAYASRSLTSKERHYGAIDKEALAWYLLYQNFISMDRNLSKIDHKPFKRILGSDVENPKMSASRLTKWGLIY